MDDDEMEARGDIIDCAKEGIAKLGFVTAMTLSIAKLTGAITELDTMAEDELSDSSKDKMVEILTRAAVVMAMWAEHAKIDLEGKRKPQ